jgi:arylsulfatase A-like enzyme
MSKRIVFLGAGGLLALTLSCSRSELPVVLDLAERAVVAEHTASWTLLLVGTPAAEPNEISGFFRPGGLVGDHFGFVRRRAEVSLSLSTPVPRTLLLDIAPYQGIDAQRMGLALNGVAMASLDLSPGRRRYRVDLPVAAQREGDNALTFEFGKTLYSGKKEAGHFAAALYALAVGPSSDPTLGDLLAQGAPPPLSIAQGPKRLVQVGPSVLHFAFQLPEAAQLHVTPDLDPLARKVGGAGLLKITLEGAGEAEREIWRGTTARRPTELTLALPGKTGDIVRLSFAVEGPPGGRFAWVVWGNPRILGRAQKAPTPEDQKVADLRSALRPAGVFYILLDAAGARHFGCYGYPRRTTPEIDRIAAEGVVFERAYTPAVFTLAAMSSVWTSQYPDENHAGVSYDSPLPQNHLTLAELLSQNGIPTAGFIANGMAGAAFGLDRGFLEFHEIYRDLGNRSSAFLNPLPPWFDAHRNGRFFLYAHVREPHFPYDPEPPYNTRFGPDAPLTIEDRRLAGWYVAVNSGRKQATPDDLAHLVRLYDGNLAAADATVGALRRALEARGLWDRTVVIISADHGEGLYEHGFISHGAQLYEEGSWVPLIVRLPRGVLGGLRVRGLVDLLDIAPTIADVFGVLGQGGSASSFRGRSLLPALVGAPGKAAVFSRSVGYRPKYALRDSRYRFIFNSRYGQERLYDLVKDPEETVDLVPSEAVLASYYRQALAAWLLTLAPATGESGEKIPLPKDVMDNLRALGYAN